jgi:omega-6 fatty acid desaturase (delta-12 desaturase)
VTDMGRDGEELLEEKRTPHRAGLLKITSQYSGAHDGKSVRQLAVTFGLWLCSVSIGLALSEHHPVATLLAAIVTAVFVVRLFMIQHDCGHRSFFSSHAANDALGFWLGVITMTPYRCWRRFHAQHHAHSGNLDRRGVGDIKTLTVTEYAALTRLRKIGYRIYRHPLVLLVIGPPLLFVLRQRTTYKVPCAWKDERRSIHLTNLGILGFQGLLCLVQGPRAALTYSLVSMSVASIIGVWLFYVQHQFPEAYWKPAERWESWRASIEGASYYELPTVLRWLTANIGLHHIHHLDARIPNYKLYECFMNHKEFSGSVRIGMRMSLGCLGLRLYDTTTNRMIPIPCRLPDTSAESAA